MFGPDRSSLPMCDGYFVPFQLRVVFAISVSVLPHLSSVPPLSGACRCGIGIDGPDRFSAQLRGVLFRCVPSRRRTGDPICPRNLRTFVRSSASGFTATCPQSVVRMRNRCFGPGRLPLQLLVEQDFVVALCCGLPHGLRRSRCDQLLEVRRGFEALPLFEKQDGGAEQHHGGR